MVTEELSGTSTYKDFEIQIGKLNQELAQRDTSIRELKEKIHELTIRDSQRETESYPEPDRGFSKWAWVAGGVITIYVIFQLLM
jgi:hypothetical protein